MFTNGGGNYDIKTSEFKEIYELLAGIDLGKYSGFTLTSDNNKFFFVTKRNDQAYIFKDSSNRLLYVYNREFEISYSIMFVFNLTIQKNVQHV